MSDVSQDDKNLGMLTHLSGILLGFIVPLIIWLMNKDKTDKDFINGEAKEALNFQITIMIGYVVCMVLTVILIGAFLMPLLWIANIVFCIIAGLKAKDGVAYRYPVTIRLIK
jgi:uncharacterized protein